MRRVHGRPVLRKRMSFQCCSEQSHLIGLRKVAKGVECLGVFRCYHKVNEMPVDFFDPTVFDLHGL